MRNKAIVCEKKQVVGEESIKVTAVVVSAQGRNTGHRSLVPILNISKYEG